MFGVDHEDRVYDNIQRGDEQCMQWNNLRNGVRQQFMTDALKDIERICFCPRSYCWKE